MIIDCHGHYTTAPKALEAWRDRQVAGIGSPALMPKPSELRIGDDELRAAVGFDRSVQATGLVPEGRSASGVIASITQIAIMLFMGVAATRLLGFPELTRMVETVLDQGASVVFGAVLIAVGVLLARMLRGLVAAAAGEGVAPGLVHWITVGLFVFIGLKQMNIGGQIIDYAFGAIAVGSAVAFALAFGLGGRDAAARKLNDLVH